MSTLWPDRAPRIRLALFARAGFTPALRTRAQRENVLLVKEL